MKRFFGLLLLSTLFCAGLAEASDGRRDVRSQLFDRRTGNRIGEVRQQGRYYDVYDRRGERKAYGVERHGVIEFFDAKSGERLPIETREGR